MNWVTESLTEAHWWRDKVCQTRRGVKLRSHALLGLPSTDDSDEEVVGEASVQHLADQEEIGGESGLQPIASVSKSHCGQLGSLDLHDGHIGGVEEADWVAASHATLAVALNWKLDTERLEIDHSGEDETGGQEVGHVWQIWAEESLTKSEWLVWPGDEKVDEGENGTLELRATASVDSHWAESLPKDLLADIGGNEERDTRAETVALLEELVKEDDNQASDDKLDDEQDANTETKLRWWTVETADDIDACLTEAHKHSQELLSGLVQFPVALQVHVDIDQASSCTAICQSLSLPKYMRVSWSLIDRNRVCPMYNCCATLKPGVRSWKSNEGSEREYSVADVSNCLLNPKCYTTHNLP